MSAAELARMLSGNTADWYFSCEPECGESFMADGFDSAKDAQIAAEAHAMEGHGSAPRYRVRLIIGRTDKPMHSLSMEWPPERS